MKRVLLTVEYDGTAYCGWQIQENGPSVQQEIQKALRRATGAQVSVTGASRTDAGVHARGQRAHFDTQATIPPEKYPYVLNTLLPRDIRVRAARETPPDFHARFDARGKIYTYRIHNHAHADALQRNMRAHVPGQLCDAAMREAAGLLVGTHDFRAFAAAGGSAKTTVRCVRDAALLRAGDDLTLLVHGTAFLYNMVRIIAGTLIAVGQGRLSPDCVQTAFQTGDRLCLGPTAPAHGLELTRVYYALDGDEAARFDLVLAACKGDVL